MEAFSPELCESGLLSVSWQISELRKGAPLCPSTSYFLTREIRYFHGEQGVSKNLVSKCLLVPLIERCFSESVKCDLCLRGSLFWSSAECSGRDCPCWVQECRWCLTPRTGHLPSQQPPLGWDQRNSVQPAGLASIDQLAFWDSHVE